tara:strand:+ start:45 stop:1433 length:1389 start_codon:yes stop_codon:yes gene_type:complete
MTYSPTATGAGQEGYWGDVYGSSSVKNQFPVGEWESRDRKYSGNLGTSKFYPIVNKETGDIAVVKVGDDGENTTIGTISADDGDFKSIEGATSQAENYFFNLPENAARVTNFALDIAQKEYNALGAAEQSATGNPNNLINPNNNIAGFSVSQEVPGGAVGVEESVPAYTGPTQRAKEGKYKHKGSDYLIFPTGLDSNGQDYMEFSSLEYSVKTVSTKGNVGFMPSESQLKNKTPVKRVILPIPGGITDNNAVDWGQASMNAAEIAKLDIALGGMEGGAEGLADAVGDVGGTIGENKESLKELLKKRIAGNIAGTGAQAMKRTTGQVMNPNMELLFNGPQLRSFGFTFKLSPRTKKEALNIVRIIRTFKEQMAPRAEGSNIFLKSPNTWRIRYMNPRATDHKFLNKFKECAMMSSTVNYTPDGSYATYSDGSMVSYQLTVNFQELEPVLGQDYDELPDDSIGF